MHAEHKFSSTQYHGYPVYGDTNRHNPRIFTVNFNWYHVQSLYFFINTYTAIPTAKNVLGSSAATKKKLSSTPFFENVISQSNRDLVHRQPSINDFAL